MSWETNSTRLIARVGRLKARVRGLKARGEAIEVQNIKFYELQKILTLRRRIT